MSDQSKPALYALTPQARATVLAALHHYQHELGKTGSTAHAKQFEDIATNGGTLKALHAEEIDNLCESLNHAGLNFSAIVPMFGVQAQHDPYVAAAQGMAREGKIEVDEPAVVSKGDDDGAYVMSWMWVSNSAAGLGSKYEPEDEE